MSELSSEIHLTPRERECAKYVAEAWNNEYIAEQMGITAHAVVTKVGSMCSKLGLDFRTDKARRVYLAQWAKENVV